MNRDQARILVEDALDQWVRTTVDVLIDGDPEETDQHWVFFFDSRAYVETRELSASLAGNGPALVRKADGGIRFASSARPWQEQLAAHLGCRWPR